MLVRKWIGKVVVETRLGFRCSGFGEETAGSCSPRSKGFASRDVYTVLISDGPDIHMSGHASSKLQMSNCGRGKED